MNRLKYLALLVATLFFSFYGASPRLHCQHIVLSEPANHTNCVELNPLFAWDVSQGTVDTYGLQVAESSSFGAFVVNKSGLTANSYSPDLSEYSFTYYWRVSATFTNGVVETSDVWSFKTKEAPPTVLNPLDGEDCASLSPVFTWESLDGASEYTVQMSSSRTFTLLINETSGITSTSFTYKMPDYLSTYYWRVSAKLSSTCETDFSQPAEFTTGPVPPTLLIPAANGRGTPLELDLSWGGAIGSDYYLLQLDDDPDFSSPIIDETDLHVMSYSVTFTENNAHRYWRVAAMFGDCRSDWAVRDFKTGYKAPTLSRPENDAICVEMTDIYSWKSELDRDTFRLQISVDPEFGSTVVDMNDVVGNFVKATLPEPITEYYWRVRAEESENIGLWSESRTFMSSLNSPILVFPENHSTGNSLSLNLVWNEETPGSRYNIQVASSSDFSSGIVVNRQDLSGSSFTLTIPENETEYFWRVQALYSVCSSSWSDVWSFKSVIGPPVLIFPENNSVKQALVPTYVWSHPNVEAIFEINIASDPDFDHIVRGQYGVDAERVVFFNPLEIETDYWWRVRATNAEGTSDWSETFKFTTGSRGPEVPILIYPENNEVKIPVNVTLRWEECARADSYQAQVSVSRDFLDFVYNESGITQTSASVSGLEYYTSYYWRAAAVNDSGRSAWSEAWKFRATQLIPNQAPELWTPANNLENAPIDITFSWNPVPRAEGYLIEASKNENFPQGELVIDEKYVWETTYKEYDLEYEQKYYWRVLGWNEAGNGPWSEKRNFTTKEYTSVGDDEYSPFKSWVYPNPLSGAAIVSFTLPVSEHVVVKIYNSIGEEIATIVNRRLNEGGYNINWETGGLPNGMYTYTIQAGGDREAKRIIIMK